MTFIGEDYVDVAARIREFKERYPEGSLQSWVHPFITIADGKTFVMYAAAAYRTPDDPRPGIGWAWEPVPGPTSFTKDSELQNAETSAWGRAIVALGFETKKIASAEEVRNRSGAGDTAAPTAGGSDGTPAGGDSPATPAPDNPAEKARLAQESARAGRTPTDDGKPENVIVPMGKHKGTRLGEVPQGYLKWLVENYEPKTPEQRRLVMAARELLGLDQPTLVGGDEDIPF